jgi:hypothetical protein
MLTSGRPICALSAIRMKSEAIAISAPAPTAKPLTAATTGFDNNSKPLADDLLAAQILASIVGGSPRLMFLEVGANAESAALAGQQHHAHVAIGFGDAQRGVEFVIELLRHRVQAMRSVQSNFGDPAARLINDRFAPPLSTLHRQRSSSPLSE